MATQVVSTIIQFKRGLSEAWARKNPILAPGEPGLALDTQVLKIGDGVTPWNSLPGTQNLQEFLKALELTNNKIAFIEQEIIPGLEALFDAEVQRSKKIDEEHSLKIQEIESDTQSSLISLLDKINANQAATENLALTVDSYGSAIAAIYDPVNGVLAQAKSYTDDAIAHLVLEGGHQVDDETIKLKDNKAYVAKVTTDILEQGAKELILNAGSSEI